MGPFGFGTPARASASRSCEATGRASACSARAVILCSRGPATGCCWPGSWQGVLPTHASALGPAASSWWRWTGRAQLRSWRGRGPGGTASLHTAWRRAAASGPCLWMGALLQLSRSTGCRGGASWPLGLARWRSGASRMPEARGGCWLGSSGHRGCTLEASSPPTGAGTGSSQSPSHMRWRCGPSGPWSGCTGCGTPAGTARRSSACTPTGPCRSRMPLFVVTTSTGSLSLGRYAFSIGTYRTPAMSALSVPITQWSADLILLQLQPMCEPQGRLPVCI
mmetsp:Transcript_26579/g.76579  ORF Transcript_26579/g.76579 Transcript_26579/m.76579 type:complete len:279 (-) Transcript_26579:106-942(-)